MKAADGISVWPIPILLGILTCVGLVAALVADGIWDAVSWIGLGLPVAVVVWFVWLAPQRRTAAGGPTRTSPAAPPETGPPVGNHHPRARQAQ